MPNQLNAPNAPLVSPDVDLTDFKFMPLEVSRLLRSEFWLDAMDTDPRVAAVSVNLWAESWHQRPAASLPDNDRVLARLAMVDRATWAAIREAVMGPWVKCSDGRFYHPVVAEKAVEAWQTKCSYADRDSAFRQKQSQRAKKRWQKGAEASADATADAGTMPRHSHGIDAAYANESKSKSKSNSKGKGNFVPKDSAYALPPSAAAEGRPAKGPQGEGYTPEFEDWWKLYPRKDEKGAAFQAFKTAIKLVRLDTLLAGVRTYAALKKADPTFIKHASTWLNGHCWNDEAPPSKPKPKFPGYVPMAGPAGG